MTTFGDVRSALHAEPSEAAFHALLELLEYFDDDALDDRVVPYALAQLERWPGEVRGAPLSMIDRMIAGERPAGLELVTSLVVPERSKPGPRLGEAFFAVLAEHDRLPALRRLSVGSAEVGDEVSYAFLERPWLATLEVLEFDGTHFDASAVRDFLTSYDSETLRELTMYWDVVPTFANMDSAQAPFLARAQLPRLERLALNAWPSDLTMFGRASWFGRLRQLELGEMTQFDADAFIQGVEAFGTKRESTITELGLMQTNLTADVLRAVLGAPWYATVETLRVRLDADDATADRYPPDAAALFFQWRALRRLVLDLASEGDWIHFDAKGFGGEGVLFDLENQMREMSVSPEDGLDLSDLDDL